MALEVLVVDDEADIRELVSGVLEDEGYSVRTAADSTAALEAIEERRPSLVLLDVWLQGSRMDGLQILQEVKRRDPNLPVLMISGHGNLDTAVAAIREGAIDFIEKPFEKDTLLSALEAGFSRLQKASMDGDRAHEAVARLQALTARERDVLDGLAKGLPNKTIAYDLGISPRTVEIYRANLMQKLQARSLSEALRVAFAAEEAQTG